MWSCVKFSHVIWWCIFCRGQFGAVFSSDSTNLNSALVHVARPNQIIWQTDTAGTVQDILHFTQHVSSLSFRIELQCDAVLENLPPPSSAQCQEFGQLRYFQSTYLLSFSNTALYIVDLRNQTMPCYHMNVGPILDVVVSGDDIFVLRNLPHRPLLKLSSRASYEPQKGISLQFTIYLSLVIVSKP